MWILALLLPLAAWSAEWSSFRGSNASGVAETTGLPVEISLKSGVEWKTVLPPGKSSPVLTTDRIFLTGSESGQLFTFALDRATGKVLWRRGVKPDREEPRHKLNLAAVATPVTDGSNVYAFFGDFGLVSYGPDGNERWRLPLGPFTNLHGMAASPILAGGNLIMALDHDSDSVMMAVDKDSGKTRWKTARPAVVHGFSTPVLFGRQIVLPGSYQLTGYDSETGKEIWSVHGLTWQVKPTAVVDADTIYATGWAPGADAGQARPLPPFAEALAAADKNGDGKLSNDELPKDWKHGGSWEFIDLDRDGRLDEREWGFYAARRTAQNATIAVRPGDGKGDLTATGVLWRYDRSVPVVSSPLLYGGILYTIKDGGILTALDAKSGAVLKQARLRDAVDSYYSSPVAADGKIYLLSENGKATVVEPGREWRQLSTTDLEEPCYATPAIAGGRIFLRTMHALYSLKGGDAR
jgi:outer membrane protein assembly factor BamB